MLQGGCITEAPGKLKKCHYLAIISGFLKDLRKEFKSQEQKDERIRRFKFAKYFTKSIF